MTAFAYLSLGLLVGALTGITSSPIAAALMAAVFTFVGASAAAFVDRKPEERSLVHAAIGSFSLACLVGLLGGIVIKDNSLLSFSARGSERGYLYLKSDEVDAMNLIHQKYVNGDLKADEAYRQLRVEIEKLGH